jgi:hypothetical protein
MKRPRQKPGKEVKAQIKDHDLTWPVTTYLLMRSDLFSHTGTEYSHLEYLIGCLVDKKRLKEEPVDPVDPLWNFSHDIAELISSTVIGRIAFEDDWTRW